jgi:hypothetical protein
MIAILADRGLPFVVDANRLDHSDQAIADRPIQFRHVPTTQLLLRLREVEHLVGVSLEAMPGQG